jgi:putative oxidoreductase
MMTMTKTSGAVPRVGGGVFSFLGRLFDAHEAVGRRLMSWLEPIFALGVRVWMGKIFFDSGLNRALNWDKQAGLFTDIHPVPGIPGNIAAIVTTAGELLLPVLLVFGLFTRVPALGMLLMAMVIEFVSAQTPQGIENGISNPQHYLWMLLFGYLFIRGGGPLSVDGFIKSQRE